MRRMTIRVDKQVLVKAQKALATKSVAKTIEKALNLITKEPRTTALTLFLAEAEQDILSGRTRPARAFVKAFKNAKRISR